MASNSQEIIYLFTLGTIGVLFLSVFVVLFFFVYQKRILRLHTKNREAESQHQHDMIAAQLESQENERKRIASDLHDSVGSLLWGAKVNAAFVQRKVQMDEEARESHDELMSILDQSIQSVRSLAWELTPEAFQHAGLSRSLTAMINRINGKGLTVTLYETGDQMWNDYMALQVYRIIQELVSNSVKHSGAKTLTVSLQWKSTHLEALVTDDGIGFKPGAREYGLGWWNILQRSRLLGATLNVGVPPIGSGTQIHLTIPLNNETK